MKYDHTPMKPFILDGLESNYSHRQKSTSQKAKKKKLGKKRSVQKTSK